MRNLWLRRGSWSFCGLTGFVGKFQQLQAKLKLCWCWATGDVGNWAGGIAGDSDAKATGAAADVGE